MRAGHSRLRQIELLYEVLPTGFEDPLGLVTSSLYKVSFKLCYKVQANFFFFTLLTSIFSNQTVFGKLMLQKERMNRNVKIGLGEPIQFYTTYSLYFYLMYA